MLFWSPTFTNLVQALILATHVAAAPWPSASKHATHSVRELRSGIKLESYHPTSEFKTFGVKGLDHPLRKRADATTEEKVKAFLADRFSLNPDTVKFRSGYKSDKVELAYLKQTHKGISFANAVGNVVFGSNGQVVSYSSSFVKPTKIASTIPSITKEKSVVVAEQAIGAPYNNHATRLEYVVLADQSAVLAHAIQVQNDEDSIFGEVFIDAHSGKLVSYTDFVFHATYYVLPIEKEDPEAGFDILDDPEDSVSSPWGWLKTSDQASAGTTTMGNNAISYYRNNISNVASQNFEESFIYEEDPSADPIDPGNKNLAIVNTFYISNALHDITYKYGFTEQAYNFQHTQIAAGGQGNDRVKISVQDRTGTNNANFAAPPDGQPGQMRMYTWDLTSPRRDGALENDIIVHEYTHGISNRLTGGGSSACLQTTESGGMGEGWSDVLAFWTEQVSSTIADYTLGQYVSGHPGGIRSRPYSTSSTVNPYTYASLKNMNEVHDIGEVWANTLVNVYAALVKQYGFDANARTDSTGRCGNTVFLHLILDGMALQPCNPTFLNARDAIIQADANRYGGANRCLLWKAFASKGLGITARNQVDNTVVPAGCGNPPKSLNPQRT